MTAAKRKRTLRQDSSDILPPVMQNALGLAVRMAATFDGSPARCRLRACRKSGRCQSQDLGDHGPACRGGFSENAEKQVLGMFLFPLFFAYGEPETGS